MSRQIRKINFQEKFNNVVEYWRPALVGELNGQHIRIARLKGVFDWHSHENEDEFFYVLSGNLCIQLPDENIYLGEGEGVVIPRGTLHCPLAEEEVQVMLFEPSTTVNTGNVISDKTLNAPDIL